MMTLGFFCSKMHKDTKIIERAIVAIMHKHGHCDTLTLPVSGVASLVSNFAYQEGLRHSKVEDMEQLITQSDHLVAFWANDCPETEKWIIRAQGTGKTVWVVKHAKNGF